MFLQEHIIRTRHGSVSVAVYGDQDKPALITYPDLALNCKLNRFFILYISHDPPPPPLIFHQRALHLICVKITAFTDLLQLR